jgi:alpha-ketoglutarate-dependent taurine dioxygenase
MELLQSLSKVIGCTTYRGCIIHQYNDGCYVWDKNRGTMQQAKDFINNAYFSFNQ